MVLLPLWYLLIIGQTIFILIIFYYDFKISESRNAEASVKESFNTMETASSIDRNILFNTVVFI